MSSSSRCCDGRTGEKICRARYLIPLIIIILAVQLSLWRYVIAPKIFGYDEDTDFENEEKAEFSEKNYIDEDSDEDQNEIYKDDRDYFSSSTGIPMDEFDSSTGTAEEEFDSSTVIPEEGEVGSSTMDTVASTELQMRSSIGNYEQRALERLKHRHRHHKKNKYVISRKTLGKEHHIEATTTITTVTTTPSWSTEAPEIVTTTQRSYQQQHRQDPVTTTKRPHSQHHHHHHHHQGTTTTTTTTAKPLLETPSNKHHLHFQKMTPEQELQRQRIMDRRREEEEKEQERMKLAHEERQRLRLSEEQERRAQRIYEQQQAELKRRKEGQSQKQYPDDSRRNQEEERKRIHEENERKRVHTEEERRRQEHERRIKQWKEDEQRKNTAAPHPPPTQQSNQWHHPDVADPWAHLRQLHEQRGRVASPTEAPKYHQSEVNEIEPFQITKHELEDTSDVWRHQENQKTEDERRKLHEQRLEESRRHHQRLEESKRLQEEARRKQHEEEHRRRQGQQHHHHSIQGALEPMTSSHTGHHSHHKHEHAQVPPEFSNEVQPTVSRGERDLAPVIVTALVDIGRGDWHRFTRPFDLYLSYLLDLLKLQNRIILYGDRSVIQFLQSQGDAIDPSRLQIIEISLQDLPYYRYKQEMQDIMKNEQENWKDSWEKATKSHPEATNPDYNILVNSKPYLLYNATQISKFDSEFFIWLDAGYSHGQKNMIPSTLWNPQLPAGKMTVIKLTGTQDKIKNYNVDHVYRKQWTVLSGGVLAGDPPTIDRFRRFYHKVFMDLLDSKKTDDDQTTLLLTAANYHNLFNVLTGGWFDAFKLLPNQ